MNKEIIQQIAKKEREDEILHTATVILTESVLKDKKNWTSKDILTWLTELIKGYEFFEEQRNITCEEAIKIKNREKFEKEILEVACSGQSLAVHKNTGVLHGCGTLDCDQCLFFDSSGEDCSHNCQKWCEAEYRESQIDWSKVSVDTPVLVRNAEDCLLVKKHFAKYENGIVYAWNYGRTSWSAMYPNDIAAWKYAKLAETE